MCFNCDTQFSQPLAPDGNIYDVIYDNADHIRGYARYSNFARMVLHKEDPLGFLAATEEPSPGSANRQIFWKSEVG
jgi:hypothetical protein